MDSDIVEQSELLVRDLELRDKEFGISHVSEHMAVVMKLKIFLCFC